MEKISDYHKKQIELLAMYHPYTTRDVELVFTKCGKSFDKTEMALRLGCAYNSIEVGIREALMTQTQDIPSGFKE